MKRRSSPSATSVFQYYTSYSDVVRDVAHPRSVDVAVKTSRDKSMADVSRQRERGCVARGGRGGAGEKRVRWSLCTCINSKLRYGSFVLVNRANLPACVTVLWIYAAPFASSRYSLVVLLVLLSHSFPSPLFPLPIFSFTDFGSGRIRDILICVCSARTRDPWDTRVSRNV